MRRLADHRSGRLLCNPAARFVAATAALGSFADWTLFAALVLTVDMATSGSAWATAAVLTAKIVPSVAFAPLAARRVDRRPLRRTLLVHEALRAGGVLLVAAGVLATSLAVAVAGIVTVEFAAAMLAAGRESYISRHVPHRLFVRVNTITAVFGYGLLPVGALTVQMVGIGSALAATVGAYALLTVSYAFLPAGNPRLPVPREADGAGRPALAIGSEWGRTVLAAGIALAPIVMLFSVAPRAAASWTGSVETTGTVTAVALAGGALGFVAANRGWSIAAGLLAAGLGLLGMLAGGHWIGLVALGFGAGTAYLGLQTRLQQLATDPSQFAAAFAVLKICAALATVTGPLTYDLGGLDAPLVTGLVLLVVAGLVLPGTRAAAAEGLRRALRLAMRTFVRVAVDVRVEGEPEDGPAVVVSNHPNALDGVLAVLADDRLRPVARWQSHPIARLGIWIGRSVVTTAGTDRDHRPAYAQAVEHLAGGGRIWLAPEGAAHEGRELLPPRTGAVRMAHAAGVPIRPLGIVYDTHPGPRLRDWRPWRRPVVTLRWGRALLTSGIIDTDNESMMEALAEVSEMNWQPALEAAA